MENIVSFLSVEFGYGFKGRHGVAEYGRLSDGTFVVRETKLVGPRETAREFGEWRPCSTPPQDILWAFANKTAEPECPEEECCPECHDTTRSSGAVKATPDGLVVCVSCGRVQDMDPRM